MISDSLVTSSSNGTTGIILPLEWKKKSETILGCQSSEQELKIEGVMYPSSWGGKLS